MVDNNDNGLLHSIHNLSDDVSAIVVREQQVMDAELLRMSSLIQEAASNLRQCFSSMSEQITLQSAQLCLRSAEAQGTGLDEETQCLLSTTNNISEHVGTAVRALQFEDIIQQLISHSRSRANEMEKMFVSIHSQIDKLYNSENQAMEEIIVSLKTCQDEINAIRDALQLNNPVKQQTLDKGDVELF